MFLVWTVSQFTITKAANLCGTLSCTLSAYHFYLSFLSILPLTFGSILLSILLFIPDYPTILYILLFFLSCPFLLFFLSVLTCLIVYYICLSVLPIYLPDYPKYHIYLSVYSTYSSCMFNLFLLTILLILPFILLIFPFSPTHSSCYLPFLLYTHPSCLSEISLKLCL